MIKEAAKTDNINGRADVFSKVSSALVCFLLALLFSGASVHDNCCVAGVAFVAAHGAQLHGLAALIGISIGYPVLFGLENTIHYVVSALFIYTIAYLLQYTRLYGLRYFMPLVSMCVIALVRAFGSITVIRPMEELVSRQVAELLACGGLTALYEIAVGSRVRYPSSWYLYSLSSIFATLLMSLSKVYVAECISIPSVLALFMYLIFIYAFPRQNAFPISILFGFALHLSLPKRVITLPLYILLSLSDIFPIKNSKWSSLIFVLCVSGITFICFGPSDIIPFQIAETIISSLLFVICPINSTFIQEKNISHGTESRFTALSSLLQNLEKFISDTSFEQPKSLPALSSIFDRAADVVCSQCVNRSVCWEAHRFDMVSILQETEPFILKRGKMLNEDLPERFKKHCPYANSLVLAINYELLIDYEEQEHINERYLSAYAMQRQMQCFSEMIKLILSKKEYQEIERTLSKDYLQGEIGVASMKKSGEQVCGDSVRYFKTKEDVLYIILSDGIGTGKNAQKYSHFVASALEDALLLFDAPMLAIELVNTALTVQYGMRWGLATIDIASVCLCTGEVTFYKMGAADSFLATENEIMIIEGNALSAGTEGDWRQCVSIQKQTVEPNSVLIMASDGASVTNSILMSQFKNIKGHTMKSAAKKLLYSTSEDNSDDRTIIMLSLK